MDFEAQQKKLQDMLDKVTDNVKFTAEAAERQLKNFGELAEETKQAADKALAEQGELRNRLNVLEQLAAKGADPQAAQHLTAGDIVANHADIAAFANGQTGRAVVGLGKMGLLNAADANAGTTAITGGNIAAPDRDNTIRPMGRCRLSVRDLLAKGRTSSNAYQFVVETGYTNAAATVLENPTDPKPRSKGALALKTEPVVTIAHHERVTKQLLADAPAFASFIDMRMRYGLAEAEEDQLLNGLGTGGELNGIYKQATAFSAPTGALVNSDTTLVDTLRLAILQAELACYYADGIIVSPVAMANFDLMKNDLTKGYLFSNPFTGGIPSLWGRTLTETRLFGATDWLVGAFATEAQLFDREDATVVAYEQDQDNVVRNMVTILAEQREVLAVYQPAAFIKNAA